jgi:regulator of RNase E activity RraA
LTQSRGGHKKFYTKLTPPCYNPVEVGDATRVTRSGKRALSFGAYNIQERQHARQGIQSVEFTMSNQYLSDAFSDISTPLIADACVRLEEPLRVAPTGIRSLAPGKRIAGRVIPVTYYGSVDIFLEAMQTAEYGDVLVVDNGGRTDEGCIGDLAALEAQTCGLAGMVVWGGHRDTFELLRIGLPVFSYCNYPAGPRRLDPRPENALTQARFGDAVVTRDDAVFADDDGVIFVELASCRKVLSTAYSIWQTERLQAEAIRRGEKLHDQLRFEEYLSKRESDPDYTFRKHLRALGGAMEE